MTLQATLDAFRADFKAGKPPYNAPAHIHPIMERATASLSVDAKNRAAKDAKKKAAKAEAAEQKQADRLANSVVTIKRIERNKRKYVTTVSGLEAFGLELKKVCISCSLHPCFLPFLPFGTRARLTRLTKTGVQGLR